MFPIPFNFPFRKKDGTVTTISDFVSSGGGSYTLPTASANTKGGVKIGSGLTMTGEVLSADGYTLPTAGADTKGGVKVGAGLSMDGEVLNNTNPTPYTLPTADTTTKGGVKVGNGLAISNEVLSRTDYSFDGEVAIGTYDNKTVYRKIITIDALPNTTYTEYPHGISNLDKVLHLSGIATRNVSAGNDAFITLPFVSSGATPNPQAGIQLACYTSNVTIQTGQDRSGFSGIVTIIYTKTT